MRALGGMGCTDPDNVSVTPLAGDAGARRYFRLDLGSANSRCKGINDRTLMAMQSPVDASFRAFIDINQLLRRQGLRIPTIHAYDDSHGFMLLEDFGDQLLKSEIEFHNGSDIFSRDILPAIGLMAQGDARELQRYDEEKLDEELQLFEDWFCEKHLGQSMDPHEKEAWTALKRILITSAVEQPQAFVHRDFHCCNVMRCSDGQLGIIDFQDAVCGPISYDLASWVWDRYISWSRETVESWMLLAREELAPNIPEKDWIKICDWMGLQRNIKIVGIFCRLHYRDQKSSYLDLLPQFCGYVIDVMKLYPELERISSPVTQRIKRYLAQTSQL